MKPRKKVHNERGVVAIETALVLPILIILLIGIVEFSILLYDKAMITNASREGARVGVVVFGWDEATNNPLRVPDDMIRDAVKRYAEANMITFGADVALVPTISKTDNDGDGWHEAGDELTVTVPYDYDFLLLPSFVGGFSDLFHLTATTVMRYE
ncbi:MAG: pilus assembly protein [Deltaproteobacteria bacterium]|nr:pilus assembly protein [Deltaproteobacteria bacterium]